MFASLKSIYLLWIMRQISNRFQGITYWLSEMISILCNNIWELLSAISAIWESQLEGIFNLIMKSFYCNDDGINTKKITWGRFLSLTNLSTVPQNREGNFDTLFL